MQGKNSQKKTNKSRIIIAGDLFPIPANVDYFVEGNIIQLFGEKLCQLFSNADLTICNLEGALSNQPENCRKIGPVLTMPTSVIEGYKRLGVDVCMLANNHITDGGQKGLIDTIETLEKANIAYIGAGIKEDSIQKWVYYDLCDTKIIIYNVCERIFNKPTLTKGGSWLYDEYIVCNDIKKLKQDCDYLVVVYHGGIEQFRYPSPEVRKRFHRMADSGADMILSQHTHCIGCEEWYNGSYLLYGQGNFLFRDIRPTQTDEALLIEIVFEKGKAEIYRHLVKSYEKIFVRYDDNQKLIDFETRSERIKDENYLNQQFQIFCRERLSHYLKACNCPTLFQRMIRKFFPKYFKNNFIYRCFNENQLLTILHTLRSEQKREEAIIGLEVLMKEKGINIQ